MSEKNRSLDGQSGKTHSEFMGKLCAGSGISLVVVASKVDLEAINLIINHPPALTIDPRKQPKKKSNEMDDWSQ